VHYVSLANILSYYLIAVINPHSQDNPQSANDELLELMLLRLMHDIHLDFQEIKDIILHAQ
jgi:hypothetical protein